MTSFTLIRCPPSSRSQTKTIISQNIFTIRRYIFAVTMNPMPPATHCTPELCEIISVEDLSTKMWRHMWRGNWTIMSNYGHPRVSPVKCNMAEASTLSQLFKADRFWLGKQGAFSTSRWQQVSLKGLYLCNTLHDRDDAEPTIIKWRCGSLSRRWPCEFTILGHWFRCVTSPRHSIKHL